MKTIQLPKTCFECRSCVFSWSDSNWYCDIGEMLLDDVYATIHKNCPLKSKGDE